MIASARKERKIVLIFLKKLNFRVYDFQSRMFSRFVAVESSKCSEVKAKESVVRTET